MKKVLFVYKPGREVTYETGKGDVKDIYLSSTSIVRIVFDNSSERVYSGMPFEYNEIAESA